MNEFLYFFRISYGFLLFFSIFGNIEFVRMCTLIKKLNNSLMYLEEVRQHLARLPSIDPATRTLILCGYPNVGKSSFVNKSTIFS